MATMVGVILILCIFMKSVDQIETVVIYFKYTITSII